jgi:hypothetical protein
MSYTESNWKTSYDSKQNGYYRPHVHFNSSSNTLDDQEFKHDSQTIPRKIRTAAGTDRIFSKGSNELFS